MTLGRINTSILRHDVMVRTFDGAKIVTVEEMDFKVTIGPYEFEIPFVIVDIPIAFNLLVAQPWMLPSNLHHMVNSFQGMN